MGWFGKKNKSDDNKSKSLNNQSSQSGENIPAPSEPPELPKLNIGNSNSKDLPPLPNIQDFGYDSTIKNPENQINTLEENFSHPPSEGGSALFGKRGGGGPLPNEFKNFSGKRDSKKMARPPKYPGSGINLGIDRNQHPLTRELPHHGSPQGQDFSETIPRNPNHDSHAHGRRTRHQEIPQEFKEAAARVRKMEPVFVRIDKFENSLKTFRDTQVKIHEISKTLAEIKNIKAQEEAELAEWETELNLIKSQIEKIDKDIFSKLE